MSDKTNIDYCDHTWSPWQGCSPVSPGCAHCYMLALKRRCGKNGTIRTLTKDWDKPNRWNKAFAMRARMGNGCSTPPNPRVLVSMCDLFDDQVPQGWFDAFLIQAVNETPNLDWLVLTKRPENIAPRLNATGLQLSDNVWLGVSAEDQQRADERIPILLSIPAKVHWVSVEPLLGPVRLSGGCRIQEYDEPKGLPNARLDWVVVGGESGFNHRRCQIEWIQSVADQCKAAGTPCFVKQDSHRLPGQQGRIPDDLWAIKQFPNL